MCYSTHARSSRETAYDLPAIYSRAVYNLGHDYVWPSMAIDMELYTIVKRDEIIRISIRITLAEKRAVPMKNSCSMLRFRIFDSVKAKGTHL